MNIYSRPVKDKDIPIICSFPQNENELFFMFPKASYPLTPSQLQEAVESRSDSTVVELDHKVVAFANFYHWETGGCCTIGNVIVSREARGQGVGRFLMEQMIAIAFSRHQAAEVTLACLNHNTAGLLLYSKLGFQPYAVEARQDKKGNRVALIHMRLLKGST